MTKSSDSSRLREAYKALTQDELIDRLVRAETSVCQIFEVKGLASTDGYFTRNLYKLGPYWNELQTIFHEYDYIHQGLYELPDVKPEFKDHGLDI